MVKTIRYFVVKHDVNTRGALLSASHRKDFLEQPYAFGRLRIAKHVSKGEKAVVVIIEKQTDTSGDTTYKAALQFQFSETLPAKINSDQPGVEKNKHGDYKWAQRWDRKYLSVPSDGSCSIGSYFTVSKEIPRSSKLDEWLRRGSGSRPSGAICVRDDSVSELIVDAFDGALELR